MPLELVTVPCLEDNYAFLIHDAQSGDTAVIDVPEAAPIKAALTERGWTLTHVLLTHHHWDHVDGLADLLADQPADHPAKVIGAAADAQRLPPLDQEVAEGDSFTVGGDTIEVIDVSGHTVGHIAFHAPASKLLFTADSLMALGCGRLFEGTPAQMHESLTKLAALPGDTTVCSGHEYTTTNAKFALTVDPDNRALISRSKDIADKRASKMPTVPSMLQLEMDTNPFLRASDPAIASTLDMTGATPLDVFTEIRARRDRF